MTKDPEALAGEVWTDTDSRLEELHDRLVTWWAGGSLERAEFAGIWDDALRRFDQRLRILTDEGYQSEDLLHEPVTMLLECFEGSLCDHDNVLAAFPYELPEGWFEFLPPQTGNHNDADT